MEKVRFGKSDLEVTRLCLGTWNMSGDKWGPENEAAAIRLIHHALDGGCNFVDTARGYGESEKVVGKALRGRREGAVIATKVIHCPPEQVAAAVDQSRQNLQTDVIDLYIYHWPSQSKPIEPVLDALVREREAGRIRAIGASNFNLPRMKIAAQFGVVSLQPPLSILWRVADEVLDFCRAQKIALTPYSPLAQGLLTGRFSKDPEPPTGPRTYNALFKPKLFPQAQEVAREVDRVASRMGCTASQVALAWVLQTPGVTVPIVGASRPEQWDANVRALAVRLSQEDYDRLETMGRRVWEQVDPEDSMWGWKPE